MRVKMRTGLYPGTFDPVTEGHLDIIRRAGSLVDRLVVGVSIHNNKQPLFNVAERIELTLEAITALEGVVEAGIVVRQFDNLLVDFAREVDASIIVRGLRAVSDFEYEYQMVGMNRVLDERVETVFLMSDVRKQAISSRLVKEIARLGGDVSRFVPPRVEQALLAKLDQQKTLIVTCPNPRYGDYHDRRRS